MDSNFVRYYLSITKYDSEYMELISGHSAVRMPVQVMRHESFSKHFLHFVSV
jgi:hypothetical protein